MRQYATRRWDKVLTATLGMVAVWLGLVAIIAAPQVALGQDSTTKEAAPSQEALTEARGLLAKYVGTADPSYGWKERRTGKVGPCRYVEAIMTSQTWQKIPWKHQLFVIVPDTVEATNKQALLLIAGGSWKDELDSPPTNDKLPGEANLLATMAAKLKTPIVILMHCPHQPIFEGRKEDEIIAYTFDKYLKGAGNDWPLLLPMVKSAVRAMDTAQVILEKDFQHKVENFTVTGGSKRGWTTWLTSAVDPRVNALAPMVIDVLQMEKQMAHQKKTWGELSDQIDDYKELSLDKQLVKPEGKLLLEIVDPYRYRAKITQPKLIILGTNDPYWPVDALGLYWNDLSGDKYILYCPNQKHGINDYRRVFSSLNALHQSVIDKKAMPKPSWKFVKHDKHLDLEVQCDVKPSRVLAWTATTPTRDFRPSTWDSQVCAVQDGVFSAKIEHPANGCAALYAELIFDEGTDGEYSLCTNLRVTPELPPTPAK